MNNNAQKEEYISRINRVIDFIENNITEEMKLEQLAKVANFSRFHFHRIFSALVGETLNQFIQRIRLERAASLLILNTKLTITDVCYECGFSSPSVFARAFKDLYEMSATEWRDGGYRLFSKPGKLKSKNGKTDSNLCEDHVISSKYIGFNNNSLLWRIKMQDAKEINVEVKDVPDFTVAYIRHIGPYKGDDQLFERLIEKLCKWAGPRGILNFPETKLFAVYHDNPDITDEEKLRTSICISIPEDTEVTGEFGKMLLQGGKYAVANFELSNDEYEEAWKAVYGSWLPQSGYQPDDRAPYELYLNDPKTHPENKCIVDIHIPVKPL
jgi:AraC family transcriptional regulator